MDKRYAYLLLLEVSLINRGWVSVMLTFSFWKLASLSKASLENRGWVSNMLTFSFWKSASKTEEGSVLCLPSPSGSQPQKQRLGQFYAYLLLLEVSLAE